MADLTTPRAYFVAYDADERQIFGTLDGQGVASIAGYRLTRHYQQLLRTGLAGRVKYWQVVGQGRVLEHIPNPRFAESQAVALREFQTASGRAIEQMDAEEGEAS